MSVDKFLFLRI